MEAKRIGHTEGILKIHIVMADVVIKNVGGIDAQGDVVLATVMIAANVGTVSIEMRKINAATLLKAGVQKRVMMKPRLNARKR